MPKNLIPPQFRPALNETSFSRRLSTVTWALLIIFGITLSIICGGVLSYLNKHYHLSNEEAQIGEVRSALRSLNRSLESYATFRNDANLSEAFRRHKELETSLEKSLFASNTVQNSLRETLQIIATDTRQILLTEESALRSSPSASQANLERISGVRGSIREALGGVVKLERSLSKKNNELWWWFFSLLILSLWVGLWIWGRRQLKRLNGAFYDTLEVVQFQLAQQKVFFESVKEVVLVTGDKGEVVYFNPEAEKLIQIPLNEARGVAIDEILAKENDASQQPLLNMIHQALHSQESFILPKGTMFRLRNGEQRLIEGSISPVLGNQHLGRVIAIFRDCSETYKQELSIRARERLYRRVFNQQSQYLIVLDAAGNVQEMNESFAKLNKGAPSDFLQKKFWELPCWQSFEKYENLWKEKLETAFNMDESLLYRESCYVQSGEKRDYDVNITVLKDENGGLIGYLIQAQDITEKALSEAQMEYAARKAKFLAQLSDTGRCVADPMDVVKVVTGHLAKFLELTHCVYAEVDESENCVEVLYDFRVEDHIPPISGTYSLLDFCQTALQELRSGAIAILESSEKDNISGEFRDYISCLPSASIFAYPLCKNGELRTILLIFSEQSKDWTPSEIELVEEVVERLDSYLERIRSEQETKQMDERFRLAVKATNDTIWDWDLTTNHVEWNGAIEQLCGYPLSEVPSHIDWWFHILHPDDAKRIDDSVHQAIQEGRDFWGEEYRIIRKDGSVAEVFDRGYLIKSDQGKPIRMIGAIQNLSERITAKKLLEASALKLQLSLDAALLGTWEYDPRSNKVLLDYRCQTLLGVEGEATMDLEIFKSCFEQEEINSLIACLKTPSDSAFGKQVIQRELKRAKCQTEVQQWLQFNGNSFFDEEGQLKQMLGTLKDVSKEKQFELSLQQAKAGLEAASKAKDNFLAALSHELRTPLTPVLMTLSAIKEDLQSTSELSEQIEMIQRNIDLESRLIDDLLDLTKITEAKLVLRLQSCNLHQLILHAVDIVKDEMFGKKQRLSLNLKAEVFGFEADPTRLQQVFWNLLRNAVKFSPPQTEIAVSTFNNESGEWIVEVKDQGIGLRPESLPVIFEPFEQAGRQNDHRFGGLGLGLAIAKGIVSMHGGEISAASGGLNQGSVFCLKFPKVFGIASKLDFPMHQEFHGQNANEDVFEKVVTPQQKDRGEKTILVVDDHEATLQVIQKLLRRRGYQVQVANCVSQALKIASQCKFDLVISDIGLPDGTGMELMRELKLRYSLPGIALSGYGMDRDHARGMQAGFSIYLTKPVNAAQLLQAVDHVLSNEIRLRVAAGL